jgi:hypothetical protein
MIHFAVNVEVEFLNIIFVNLFPVIKNYHILIWCVKNTHTRVHTEAILQKKSENKNEFCWH